MIFPAEGVRLGPEPSQYVTRLTSRLSKARHTPRTRPIASGQLVQNGDVLAMFSRDAIDFASPVRAGQIVNPLVHRVVVDHERGHDVVQSCAQNIAILWPLHQSSPRAQLIWAVRQTY